MKQENVDTLRMERYFISISSLMIQLTLTFQLTKNQFKRTYLLRKKLQNQMNLLCGFTKCQLFVKNVTEIVL